VGDFDHKGFDNVPTKRNFNHKKVEFIPTKVGSDPENFDIGLTQVVQNHKGGR